MLSLLSSLSSSSWQWVKSWLWRAPTLSSAEPREPRCGSAAEAPGAHGAVDSPLRCGPSTEEECCAVDPPPKRRLRGRGPEADIWDRLYVGDLSHQSPNTRASTLELLRLLDEKGEDGKDVADVAEKVPPQPPQEPQEPPFKRGRRAGA